MTFKRMTPMLQVLDLKQTLAFYTDVLGFEVMGTFPQEGEPFWASVRAGEAQIMFSYQAPHTHDDGETHEPEALFNGSLYFYPEDLDPLHAKVQANAANCSGYDGRNLTFATAWTV